MPHALCTGGRTGFRGHGHTSGLDVTLNAATGIASVTHPSIARFLTAREPMRAQVGGAGGAEASGCRAGRRLEATIYSERGSRVRNRQRGIDCFARRRSGRCIGLCGVVFRFARDHDERTGSRRRSRTRRRGSRFQFIRQPRLWGPRAPSRGGRPRECRSCSARGSERIGRTRPLLHADAAEAVGNSRTRRCERSSSAAGGPARLSKVLRGTGSLVQGTCARPPTERLVAIPFAARPPHLIALPEGALP